MNNDEQINDSDVDNSENAVHLTKDERDALRIEEWHAAAEQAAGSTERAKLRERVELLQQELEAAKAEYASGMARAATVWGWNTIAEEQGVSAKQIHTWHRNFTPDLPDLSRIPEQEMKRQQKRAEEIRRQIESEERLRAQLAEHEEKMNRIQEALHGK